MTPEQFELFAEIEESHWWFVARRQILSAVVERVAPAHGEVRIVDVGCGTGANIAAFAGRYACLGLDANADAIRLARARFPDVRFEEARSTPELGAHVARADVLLCTDVIEHVEHDASFLGSLVGAMRPGSQLVLTVPADMALWSAHDVTNHHFRRYDASGLERVWLGMPVRVRLFSAFNSRLYPVVRAMRGWHRLRGGVHGEAGTDFAMPRPAVNRVLRSTFAGEARALLSAVDTPRRPYGRGVSLIAVLERVESAGGRS